MNVGPVKDLNRRRVPHVVLTVNGHTGGRSAERAAADNAVRAPTGGAPVEVARTAPIGRTGVFRRAVGRH